MSDRRHYNDSLPQEESIQQGKVIRLEPSFCILQLLDFHRMRGLLHVSEMTLNGAKVDEVMSLDDVLYCKVLSVTTEEGPEGRPRHRIKLSIRDVNTKTGEPLATTTNPQQQQLSQNLNSTIGMGVALDPMAASNLILKNATKSSGSLINGYALVDDNEGEPDLPPPPEPSVSRPPMGRGRGTALPAWMTRGDGPVGGGAEKLPSNEGAVRPMGRGRGTTLPAWMTRGDSAKEDKDDASESRHGKHGRKERKKHSRKRDRDDRDRRHHSRKHHRRDERRRSRSRDRDDSSHDKRHRKKKHRREDRRRSPSFDSHRNDSRRGEKEHNLDDRRHSRRQSPSLNNDSDRSRSRHRKKHSRKSRRRSHSYSSSGSDRNGRRPRSESETSHGGEKRKSNGKHDAEFSSVAEAKRLIAELEDKKRRRDESQ